MNDRIIELEEYKNAIVNKKNLDNGSIAIDELSLEEIEDVKQIYQKDISSLNSDIQTLAKENKLLRKMLEIK